MAAAPSPTPVDSVASDSRSVSSEPPTVVVTSWATASDSSTFVSVLSTSSQAGRRPVPQVTEQSPRHDGADDARHGGDDGGDRDGAADAAAVEDGSGPSRTACGTRCGAGSVIRSAAAGAGARRPASRRRRRARRARSGRPASGSTPRSITSCSMLMPYVTGRRYDMYRYGVASWATSRMNPEKNIPASRREHGVLHGLGLRPGDHRQHHPQRQRRQQHERDGGRDPHDGTLAAARRARTPRRPTSAAPTARPTVR